MDKVIEDSFFPNREVSWRYGVFEGMSSESAAGYSES
jgi:hypothetical protein